MYSNISTGKINTGCCTRRISWSGIFAGVVAGLVIEALLNLLGMGIGFLSLAPNKGAMAALGIGSAIWLIITSVIAMFLGGWVAANASGKVLTRVGALHGFVTWGLASLMALFLMASATGAIIGGAAGIIGKGLRTAGEATLNNQDNFLPDISTIRQRIKSNDNHPPKEVIGEIKNSIGALISSSNDQDKAAAEQRLSVVLTQNTDLSQDEANQKIKDFEQSFQQLKDKAADTAKKASKVMGGIAIVAFFSFLLGAIAAIIGGTLGVKRNRVVEEIDRDKDTTDTRNL